MRKKPINLTPKQHHLLKDILTEARAVAQQVSTLCNPSQKKRYIKQAKDIQLLINKVRGNERACSSDDTNTGDDNEEHN